MEDWITCAECRKKVSESKTVKLFEPCSDRYKPLCLECLESIMAEISLIPSLGDVK